MESFRQQAAASFANALKRAGKPVPPPLEASPATCCPEKSEKPLPSKGRMAVNVIKSGAKATVSAVTRKAVLAPETVQTERLETCLHCPTDQYRPSDGRCAACGCFIRAKVKLAPESCPQSHWPAVP